MKHTANPFSNDNNASKIISRFGATALLLSALVSYPLHFVQAIELEPAHSWDVNSTPDRAPQPATTLPPLLEQDSANCSLQELAVMPQASLIEAIRAANSTCLNSLFSASGQTAQGLFNEDNMVALAQALEQDAQQYSGSPLQGSRGLVLFLRAGYYVQFYGGNIPDYTERLSARVSSAVSLFTNKSEFYQLSESNAELVSEVVTLIDSAELNFDYLPKLTQLFSALSNTQADGYWAPLAVNNVLTVFFRAHYLDDAQDWFVAHTDVIDDLAAMAARQDLIASGAEYVVASAAAETARFYQYGDTFNNHIDAILKGILKRYSFQGDGASVWLAAADMIDYFLPQKCQEFGLCGFVDDIEETILNITHQCSDQFTIRAQSLTDEQRGSVCSDLATLQSRFHQLFNTAEIPVDNDYNEHLEVVVFASSDQYQLYGSVLFGISTNNGGIYLEGDPSDMNNQARFIAYVAEWKSEFEVWNLMHEAVHYLDGRFNMKGDFNDTMSADTVWWVEGIAEYVSKLEDNADAIDVGQQKSWNLSQLFYTTYNESSSRIYDWGYLASRYMFSNQRETINDLLMFTRAGNYSSYQTALDTIGSRHDDDFNGWLDCLATGSDDCDDGNDPIGETLLSESNIASNQSFWRYVWVPQGYDRVMVSSTGGEGDLDIFVKYDGWPSTSDYDAKSTQASNAEQLNISARSGNYLHILLQVNEAVSDVSIRVTATPSAQ